MIPVDAVTVPGSQRFVRRVLPAMLVGVLAAVAAVDLVVLVLASGYEHFRLPADAAIRFAPATVVADLRLHRAELPVAQIGGRYTLVSGWARAVGGGVWLEDGSAVIDLESGAQAPVELVVRARASGPIELAMSLDGESLGARELAGGDFEVRRWPLPAGLAPATIQRLALTATARQRARESVVVAGVALATIGGVPWSDLVRPAVLVDGETRTVAMRQPGRLVFSIPPTGAAHELHLEYRFARPQAGSWPEGRGAITLRSDGHTTTVAALDAGRQLHDRLQVQLGATDGSARLEVALTTLAAGAVLVLDDPVIIPGSAFLMAPGPRSGQADAAPGP